MLIRPRNPTSVDEERGRPPSPGERHYNVRCRVAVAPLLVGVASYTAAGDIVVAGMDGALPERGGVCVATGVAVRQRGLWCKVGSISSATMRICAAENGVVKSYVLGPACWRIDHSEFASLEFPVSSRR